MTRAWESLLQLLDELVGVALACVVLFAAALVAGLLHYFYPRWIPRSLRWPGSRRKRRPEVDEQLDVEVEPDDEEDEPEPEEEAGEHEVPELPAHVFAALADRLAAQGRYAEAVRERLRSIVRGLVERQVLEHRPGMTVTELARAAASARPAIDTPLRAATGIFSDIWYGQHPATAEHDQHMKALATEVGR